MRNPNVRILVIAAVLIVIVAAAGLLTTQAWKQPAEADAQAYLRVQAGSEIWPLIPLAEGGEHVIDQGSGRVNVVHTTATSIRMHSSTCDNQNCVDQGEVSLTNGSDRVLGNMIVCLPNEVILEILPASEAGAN